MIVSFYKNIVPTELKRSGPSHFYKHIVPTGLNIRQSQSSCQFRGVHNNTDIVLSSGLTQNDEKRENWT